MSTFPPGAPGLPDDQSSAGLSASQIRVRVHEKLLRETEFIVLQHMTTPQLRERVQYLTEVVAAEQGLTLSARVKEQLQEEVIDEIVGFGPIQGMLDDPNTEVVNGPFSIRRGRGCCAKPRPSPMTGT